MKHYVLLSLATAIISPVASEHAEDRFLLENSSPIMLAEYKELTNTEDVIIHPEVKVDSIDMLIQAMIYVESRGNDSIVNSINAAGCLQIRPIMVEEVNRILSKKKDTTVFTNQDRFSRDKSIKMFNIWREYHHADSPLEKMARCWNGGGNGHKMKATKVYWKLVKEKLNIKV